MSLFRWFTAPQSPRQAEKVSGRRRRAMDACLRIALRVAAGSGMVVLLSVPSLTHSPAPARAALTLVVNSVGDGSDALNGDGLCQTTTPGECTLRAAIEEANTVGGTDTINFSILSGVQTIAPLSQLPAINDPVIIDGTTQPGFSGSPLIQLDGEFAGNTSEGLLLSAGSDGSTVRGLVINRWRADGIELLNVSGVSIDGNYIGTDVTGTISLGNSKDGVLVQNASGNTIGGTAGNVISANVTGIEILGVGIGHPTTNIIRNNKIGTSASGTAANGNLAAGVQITNADTNLVGGSALADRNIISANGTGIDIRHDPSAPASNGNSVVGNYIGTDVTGATALANGLGINIASGANIVGGTFGVTPGGPCTGACNLISANANGGIIVSSGGKVTARGNLIGTDAAGTSFLGGQMDGITLDTGTGGSTIGAPTAGAGNLIAGNTRNGVRVVSVKNAIRSNSIHSNGALGISVSACATCDTPNDPGDPDAGANNRQNFPTITAAIASGGTTTIYATLNGPSTTLWAVQFFSNGSCDPSTFGEGQTLLASTTATTNVAGDVAFNTTIGSALAAGTPITATATDPLGNTSEFAKCFAVTTSAAGLDRDGDNCSDASEATPSHVTGGQRDADNRWDFFDVPTPVLLPAQTSGTRSGAVSIFDVVAILNYIGTTQADPDTPNARGAKYGSDLDADGWQDGSEYDRAPGATTWATAAPNGAVSIADALLALNQVGDHC